MRSGLKSEAVRAGAKRFAAELAGPFGRRSLHWVVERHIDYFEAAREAGATWVQIARALALAGAANEDGSPITGRVLSATVSRVKRSGSGAEGGGEAAASEHTNSRPSKAVVLPKDEKVNSPESRSTSATSLQATSPADISTVRQRMERAAALRGKQSR